MSIINTQCTAQIEFFPSRTELTPMRELKKTYLARRIPGKSKSAQTGKFVVYIHSKHNTYNNKKRSIQSKIEDKQMHVYKERAT